MSLMLPPCEDCGADQDEPCFDGCSGDQCFHDWTLRPESDTYACEWCGAER